MRATGCLCALLGVLLALPAAIAEAKITPLPKPAGISAKPAASTRGSLIAPVLRPATHPTVRPAGPPPPRPQIASRPSTPATRTTSAPRSRRFVPVASDGGRKPGWVAPSGGGRDASAYATPTALAPTPLGLVGAGEALPTYDAPWPSWMIPLLTMLAAGEGFVLVRLVRGRLAQIGEI
jgi:hypothetical protein